MLNVQTHLNEAIMDNRRVFRHLDTNNDGIIIFVIFLLLLLLQIIVTQTQIHIAI